MAKGVPGILPVWTTFPIFAYFFLIFLTFVHTFVHTFNFYLYLCTRTKIF